MKTLPSVDNIDQLIKEFEEPSEFICREFASHRRDWIIACLQLARSHLRSESIDECLRLAVTIEAAAAVETIGGAGCRLPVGSPKIIASALRDKAKSLFEHQIGNIK
jgi:hypothetical protein